MYFTAAFVSLFFVAPQGPTPGLRLTDLQVRAEIVDGVATTELRQTLRNGGRRVAEADWILPLAVDATVDRFTMTVGGKEIAGEVLDAGKARATYEAIVRKRRDPGLLEYVGRGCLRARIFPIPASGQVVVKVRYRQVLVESDGLLQWSFPLRAPQAGGLRPEHVSADIAVRSHRPIRNVFSALPGVDTAVQGEHEVRATLELGAGELPPRDLTLFVGLDDREFGLHVLTYRRPPDAGYFMAMLAPKRTWESERTHAKAVQFVLDSSGSMKGVKIEQACAALRFFVQSLGPRDTFNVIPFATEARPFFAAPVAADRAHVQEALQRIERIDAVGGTHIEDALRTALAAPADAGRVPLTVFLTDGRASVGVTDTAALIAKVAGTNRAAQRVFVFGVGNDVNTELLDRIAEETRGHRDYIAEHENIELVTSALLTRISHPVLTDLELHTDEFEAHAVVPRRLPDLFAGSRLLLFGRYDEPGSGEVRLCGRVAGAPIAQVYSAEFAAQDTRHDFIPALWAQRRVGTLLDAVRLHGARAELLDEVTRLGKEFGIVTPYTSHLIVEETARVGGDPAPRWRNLRRGDRGHHRGPGDVAPPGGGGARGPMTPAPSTAGPGSASPVAARPTAGPRARPRTDEARQSADRLRRLGTDRSGSGAVADSQHLKDVTGSDDLFHGASRRRGGPASPPAAPASRSLTRRAGGRTFYLANDVWIDRAYQKGMKKKIERIEVFSAEYFALLQEAPDLAPCFALGTRVRVVWARRVIEVCPAKG